MDNSTILKSFNEHFIDFVSDIQQVFPEDPFQIPALLLKAAGLVARRAFQIGPSSNSEPQKDHREHDGRFLRFAAKTAGAEFPVDEDC